jgi:hypothetical protein
MLERNKPNRPNKPPRGNVLAVAIGRATDDVAALTRVHAL